MEFVVLKNISLNLSLFLVESEVNIIVLLLLEINGEVNLYNVVIFIVISK